jgi:hypothetical protein
MPSLLNGSHRHLSKLDRMSRLYSINIILVQLNLLIRINISSFKVFGISMVARQALYVLGRKPYIIFMQYLALL